MGAEEREPAGPRKGDACRESCEQRANSRAVAGKGGSIRDADRGESAGQLGGAGEGNRTPDLLITSEPLCRLSYPGDGAR